MLCASSSVLAKHQPPAGHPDTPQRITAVWDELERRFGPGTVSAIDRVAAKDELRLAHSRAYIERLFALNGKPAQLDYETSLSEHSLDAARAAAGICLELVERIARGTCRKGFALIRPPGHHAGYGRAMGYCVINNMAIAARKAQRLGIQRIAIIDWDAHHGNGTQELFEESDAVLFIDIHQADLFPPHSGGADERGTNQGAGFTINIPVPPCSKGTVYIEKMDTIMYPALAAYKPQLICVSAGFDALEGDPQAAMFLTPRDFGLMTRKVCEWADTLCGGKVFMALEGGYHNESLPAAIGECVAALYNRNI